MEENKIKHYHDKKNTSYVVNSWWVMGGPLVIFHHQ